MYGSSQQSSLSDHYLDTTHFIITMGGDISFNSTAVTNNFASSFINGNFISSEDKDIVSSNMLSSNTAGGDMDAGVGISFMVDRVLHQHPYHMQLIAGVYDRQHFDTRFGKELFELAFFGNKTFAGDTAMLDNASISYLHYQQLQFGILNDNGMGRRLSASISFLNGEKLMQLKTGDSFLYTSDIGDDLYLYANTEIWRSDTATNNNQFNGWGLSTDLMYEINYNTSESNMDGGFLRMEINDLGFIRWNPQSFHYNLDTTFSYSGLYIDDIFDLRDSLFSYTSDSISDSYKKWQKKQGSTIVLPTLFRLTLGQRRNRRQFMLGIWYKHLANFTPYLYLSEGYWFNKFFNLSARIAYGGYGKLSFGMATNLRLGGFELHAGTTNLEGVFYSKTSSGFSAFASLSKQF